MLPPALLRRPLAAAAGLALPHAGPQVRLATGPRQNNGIFYEIRTYDIKPAKMKEFLKMVNKYFHFRTAHSELVGFWYSELGAMNKVFHIWKYDNFAHRTAVWHALANDKDWQGKFISEALPLVEKQHNEVVYLVPWCQLGKPSKKGVHVLWWNESPDHRAAGRHSAHEDARVVAAVRDSVRFLESLQNVLLIPLQCSLLK
ncbi:protein NipSnap homolog 3A isoform X2 [Vidua chalybeata]|uniref:protein NipSnap homolog 3A isoform X2 n=1 Tax=Vidua chalybeata TaxID=81927 RepID=UPI0023A80E8F|nr:protein NipSnap homolog 3A isoform X2 [Vidua chalybeata]